MKYDLTRLRPAPCAGWTLYIYKLFYILYVYNILWNNKYILNN